VTSFRFSAACPVHPVLSRSGPWGEGARGGYDRGMPEPAPEKLPALSNREQGVTAEQLDQVMICGIATGCQLSAEVDRIDL
jgi:hypothetical protein